MRRAGAVVGARMIVTSWRRAGAVIGARTIATSWAVSIVVRGEIRSLGIFVITVRM